MRIVYSSNVTLESNECQNNEDFGISAGFSENLTISRNLC
ncbi:MAG: hypothetical protein ACTSQF_07130 [Candidatus Heimdallarchaeaceae archaeon]